MAHLSLYSYHSSGKFQKFLDPKQRIESILSTDVIAAFQILDDGGLPIPVIVVWNGMVWYETALIDLVQIRVDCCKYKAHILFTV